LRGYNLAILIRQQETAPNHGSAVSISVDAPMILGGNDVIGNSIRHRQGPKKLKCGMFPLLPLITTTGYGSLALVLQEVNVKEL